MIGDQAAMTAAELKAARERLGLGPVAMARRLGMTYRNYQYLERGAKIREAVALLVAAILEREGGTEPRPKAREQREREHNSRR